MPILCAFLRRFLPSPKRHRKLDRYGEAWFVAPKEAWFVAPKRI